MLLRWLGDSRHFRSIVTANRQALEQLARRELALRLDDRKMPAARSPMMYLLSSPSSDLEHWLAQIAVVPVDPFRNDSAYWLSLAKQLPDKDRFLLRCRWLELGDKNWSKKPNDLRWIRYRDWRRAAELQLADLSKSVFVLGLSAR